MKTGRKGVALGYGAPAKQSTGTNEVSEADERIAKVANKIVCLPSFYKNLREHPTRRKEAQANRVRGTPKKTLIYRKKWRNLS